MLFVRACHQLSRGFLRTLMPLEAMRELDAAILAVQHEDYASMGLAGLSDRFSGTEKAVLLDIKGLWDKVKAEKAGFSYWRL